jgi:hypothetical protein
MALERISRYWASTTQVEVPVRAVHRLPRQQAVLAVRLQQQEVLQLGLEARQHPHRHRRRKETMVVLSPKAQPPSPPPSYLNESIY